MELFTGTSASELSKFLSYSGNNSIRTTTHPLAAPTLSPGTTTMDSLKAESSSANADGVVAMTNDIRENGGSLPESPGLGMSGANPRLVNGEATVSSIGGVTVNGEKSDVQRLSAAQSVLKKVLSVSEAEGLLSSSSQSSGCSAQEAEIEIERGVVNGGDVVNTDVTPDGPSKSAIPSLNPTNSIHGGGMAAVSSLSQPNSTSTNSVNSMGQGGGAGPSMVAVHQLQSVSSGGDITANGGSQLLKQTTTSTSKSSLSTSPGAKMGGTRNGGARQHRGSGGNGGMVMSTASAAPNNVYYHYVPVPNPPLYYTQPQQYPTSPAVHPSLAQPPAIQQEKLSSTNLYIRGLSRVCSDEDLVTLCKQYGKIVSTKAILDKHTNLCKGYGFVDFEDPGDAMKALHYLQSLGISVQFAKLPLMEQDPTNLYFSNLPKDFDERDLETLISPYGVVVSTRILRDQAGASRGVGFARMETQESCDRIIEALKGGRLPGHSEPLQIKFADSGSKKKNQNKWREMQEQQYVYEAAVIPQNGIVNSHGIVRQGVIAPYIPTPATAIPGTYQVPASSQNWTPAYYMPPGQNPIVSTSTVDSVHALGAQMSGLQISTAGGPGAATGAYPALHPGGGGQPPHQPSAQYQITPHGPQYAHQTASGWNVQHLSTPATILHQDHSTDHHGNLTTGIADVPPTNHPPHPIQVINTPDHFHHHGNTTGQQVEGTSHSIHVYHPNNVTTSWSGK